MASWINVKNNDQHMSKRMNNFSIHLFHHCLVWDHPINIAHYLKYKNRFKIVNLYCFINFGGWASAWRFKENILQETCSRNFFKVSQIPKDKSFSCKGFWPFSDETWPSNSELGVSQYSFFCLGFVKINYRFLAQP